MYPVHIKSFETLTVAEYHRIVQAREQVFFLEQHVTCPDADKIDTQSVFLWMETAGCVIAFLRIIPRGVVYEEASIGRVLVAESYRRQGLCRKIILRALKYIADEWGEQPVRISAQSYLTNFYRSLRFEVISEEYAEAGIPHVKMQRR